MRIAEIYRSPQGEGRLTGVESVFVRTSGCNLRCCFCDTPYASWAPEGDYLSVEEVLAAVENVSSTRRAPTSSGTRRVPDTLDCAAAIATVEAAESVRHVVITGGEPMLFAALAPISAALHRRGMHVTIETAGTRYQPVQCDLMAVSPKLSNSTPRAGDCPDFRGAPAKRGGENGTVPFDAAAVGRSEWIELHERNRAAPDVLRRLNAEYDCQFKFVVGSLADCAEVRAYLAGFPEIDRRRVLLMPVGTKRAELATIGQWLEPYCREHSLTFCPRRHIEWFGCCRGT